MNELDEIKKKATHFVTKATLNSIAKNHGVEEGGVPRLLDLLNELGDVVSLKAKDDGEAKDGEDYLVVLVRCFLLQWCLR